MCGIAAPQAVIALAKQLPDRFTEFVSYVFERQSEFNAAAGDTLSQAALKEVFCSMAESFGADRARFAEDISLIRGCDAQCQGVTTPRHLAWCVVNSHIYHQWH